MDRVFLLPGEMAYTRQQKEVATLLGSCVAVCLHDTRNRYGGMNHYMLPRQTGTSDLSPGKYGDYAIGKLLEIALRSGSKKHDLVASVFGGGNVVGHLGSVETTGRETVGAKNIELARRMLERNSIKIIREEVGGNYGRKIFMDSATNQIDVRTIVPSEENQARADARGKFKRRAIGVLVVDDSSTVRKLIRAAIEECDDMEVIGEAANPFEARERILEKDPDVICLDIIMPRMDGHTFLQKLMRYKPIPIVVVSTIAKRGSEMRTKVMNSGAVDVVDKEELDLYKGLDVVRKVLIDKLRHAAETPVKRRG